MKVFPKIALSTKEGYMVFLRKDEIKYCTSSGSYTHIFASKERKFTVAKRLKIVTDLLADDNFVRIHHSHLVNLSHVKYYRKAASPFIELSCGERLPISKAKTAAFLQKFIRL